MVTATLPNPHAVALTRAGLLAIKAGCYRDSARLLTRAVQLDPGLAEAWRWLGALHSGAKRAVCLQWAQRALPGATIPVLPTPTLLPANPEAPAASASHVRRRPKPAAQRALRHARIVGGSVLLASALAIGGFELAYADRIYPGVQAFGQSLSGLSPLAARDVLAPALQSWSAQNLVINDGEQLWIVRFSGLADFSPAAAAERAYGLGRAGSLPDRIGSQGDALFRSAAGYPLAGDTLPLDQGALGRVLDQLDQTINRPAIAAAFATGADGWSVKAEQSGRRLDRAAAEARIRAAWSGLDWSGSARSLQVDLPLQTVAPAITAADLRPRLARLQAQTAAPLVLQADGAEWRFDRSSLLDLAALPAPGSAFPVRREALRAVLRDIAAQHHQAPVASSLTREGNRAVAWQLPRMGRSLDLESAMVQVAGALEGADPAALALPFVQSAPPAGDLEALGIVGVVGRGSSQFASYSAPNRDANVVAGGNEFDGLLVPPGELLSFTGTVGDITPEKGYQMGEMIAGGQVVPSYGGGICQVSTTLYRAAFWGGLPIEERHNHSWRLAWYEADAPPGMDATIALGGPDLKIRNDTAGWLLLDVDTDTVNKTQTFTIYGTPRDQQVSLLGPTWDGAGGLVITRQIVQHGAVVGEDSWTSYYSQ